jgi:quercetin 2,3-dioxygenase
MDISSEARIYLAEHRGVEQEDWFRTYHTMNFGAYRQPSRDPFYSLLSINDHTLAAGITRYYSLPQSETIILLPIVGRLTYRSGAESGSVDVGQIACVPASQTSILELTNPYNRELINFLQIRVACISTKSKIDTFDLEQHPNRLIPLLGGMGKNLSFYIGRFDGRKEIMIDLSHRRLFAFVIEGAFELEGRLIQSRDGLAVWNTAHADLEALSDNAIILITEPV